METIHTLTADYAEKCTHSGWELWANQLRNVSNDLEREKKQRTVSEDELASRSSLLAWSIGDWLLAGKRLKIKKSELRKQLDHMFATHYKNGSVKRKYAEGTLNNFMTVCKAIPASRRRENVGFSLHLEIAKLPEQDQETIFNDIANGYGYNHKIPFEEQRPMSVRELKKMINHLREGKFISGEPNKKQSADKRGPQDTLVVIKGVPNETYDKLQDIANKMYRSQTKSDPFPLADASVGSLVWVMAAKWFSEHKEEMKQYLPKPVEQPAVKAEPEPELATNTR